MEELAVVESVGIHAVITITPSSIRFHISDGTEGAEIYGYGEHHFSAKSAWRAVEKILNCHEVVTTEVIRE
jgi:hypothetical protein